MAKARALSIYLLKGQIANPETALKVMPSLRTEWVKSGKKRLGLLAYRTTPAAPPRWVDFFVPSVNPKAFQASSVSAAFILPAANRQFVLTFGHGRHLLLPDVHEEGFGLRVTLNSVTAEAIRTIDRKTLDASGRHLREQATRNIPLVEFGLDIDKDILCSVTGPPTDKALGKRLTGADPLSTTVEVTLANLQDLLAAYLAQYEKTTYREHFPFVDNIREEKGASRVAALDAKLVKAIQLGELERIWMAVPELLDWTDIDGFSYTSAESAPHSDDIDLPSYLEHLGGTADLAIDRLRHGRVYAYSVTTEVPLHSWPVYRCLYAEFDQENTTFLLNGGRWYRVAKNYIQEVNEAVSKVPASSTLVLPPYSDANERVYNERVFTSDPTVFALLDGHTIGYGGGHSRIEFCDLLTKRKELVHVKRYGGSSVLSHLFAQGLVSAAIFLNDAPFRKKINALVPPSHQIAAPDQRPQSSDYEVAFVVASKVHGKLVLPFFSRVTLRSTYQQLLGLGFHVTLTKVTAT